MLDMLLPTFCWLTHEGTDPNQGLVFAWQMPDLSIGYTVPREGDWINRSGSCWGKAQTLSPKDIGEFIEPQFTELDAFIKYFE